MVPLPLFKLAALFVRHVSKYGANQIKARAHDHPRFRAFAARYGQSIHQLNMRMSVALLRDPEAERRAKERAEAPTVKTEEQHKRDEAAKEKASAKAEHSSQSSSASSSKQRKGFTFQNVWKRKFRPLPEAKAVDLFADVIGDTFILGVAGGLIIYETWKASRKPDANKERIDELDRRFEELKLREDELAEAEERQRQRGANTPEAAARIDRLSMLDGNGKAAVILLFADSDDTASFMELQMRFVKTPYLSHGGNACGYADQVL
ncbi:OPA3 family protein [Purpureocillium lavendulum]|uniref:OPA3 family protein n=1 Tax=Purpureocillium lavendulum TaxID=1247861 RepID=A0AB34G211_9HYPO|nr:OPA3 family protein [Purpureocillium lavendulum]